MPPITLTNSITLYPSPSTPPTSLIILTTWLSGATPRRIEKYTAGYRHHFPNATILLITTTLPDITLRSVDALRESLKPARGVISDFLTHGSEVMSMPKSILLHVFSHGGSNTATQLARLILSVDGEEHRRFIEPR
ncbi:hypothetical protein BDW59DRAFT_147793 [Aspergillus cavernicola]|uniref:Uncharacterized protein n=1 Tax=Aspergillus cavernicola TaxID=176166 RepID=A0ABR4I987_9EURO